MTARKEVCVRGWVGVWVRVWPLSEDKGTCARTHSNVLSGFHNVDYPGFFGGLGLAHIHTHARARTHSHVLGGFHNVGHPGFFGGLGLVRGKVGLDRVGLLLLLGRLDLLFGKSL